MDARRACERSFIVYFGIQLDGCGLIGLNDDRHIGLTQQQAFDCAAHAVATDFVATENDLALIGNGD